MIAQEEIKKFPNFIKLELAKAIRILKSGGAKKVILFGSLAKNKFRHHSDIDLACEGIADERFYSVFGKLLFNMKMPCDLVDMNDADDFFANRIKEEGIILYEK